jgi:hypothetical protein
MKMYKISSAVFLVAILLASCAKEDISRGNQTSGNELENGWKVPLNKLTLSHLPPDRIQSIDAPHFVSLEGSNLKSGENVYVYRYGDTVKVYPQNIMGVHEIVNDRIGDHYFTVSFCPLTGSALVWNREIRGEVTEFGVSGHLFNDNLIPYDRNDSSYWSQMNLLAIKGVHAGEELESGFLLLTTGSTIIKSFPTAMVLVDTSGHNCDSICGGLKQGLDLGDPNEEVIELPGGDLFGIIKGEVAMLFNYDNFGDAVKVYHSNFRASKVIVVGSESLQFIAAFRDNSGDPEIQYSPIQNELPLVFEDSHGNRYDMTGLAVSGPSAGKRLPVPVSYTAHSFAWNLFFNQIELFEK